jgi:molybdate transport system substrate-binding protein
VSKIIQRVASAFLYVSAGLFTAAPASAGEINMAVANSTCETIKNVGKLFEQRTGTTINYLCKSSGRIAKALHGGSITADIYISASLEWMEYMFDNGMVKPENVTSPWGNTLVVASRKDSPLEISEWEELASNKVNTILIGDPGTAPFGRYAKQSLEFSGLWERVRGKIETKKHITLLADTLADADDITVGILFASNVTDKHKKIYSIDESWHIPIRYYMAPVKDAATNPSVVDYLDFIQGKESAEIFRSAGFKLDEQ